MPIAWGWVEGSGASGTPKWNSRAFNRIFVVPTQRRVTWVVSRDVVASICCGIHFTLIEGSIVVNAKVKPV